MTRVDAKICAIVCIAMSATAMSGCKGFKHDVSNPMAFRDFQRHVAAIDEAEAIDDPVERCLRYPIPPEFHWPQALIEALCADMHTPVYYLSDIKRLIDAKDWAGLEAHYAEILRRHYSGEDPEYLIYRSFPLYGWKSSQEADDYTLRWLEGAPDDAYANMTRGNLLAHRAWQARAGGSSSETDKRLGVRMISDETQMKKSAFHAENAQMLLRKSLVIEPRLMPAYNTLINAEMLAGDVGRIGETFSRAIRQSPHSYYVRNTRMNFSEPRWGGSLREMDRLVEEAEPYVAHNPRLAMLRTRRAGMDANHFLAKEQYGPALDQHRKALEFGPEQNSLGTAANIAYRERHYTQAIVYYTQEIRFSRDIANMLSNRGAALEKIGEPDRAYCDYQAAIKDYPGEAWSNRRIPKLEQLFVSQGIDRRFLCGPNNAAVKALRKKLGMK
jgi:tetratricopeptide (TPR) repeat protein